MSVTRYSECPTHGPYEGDAGEPGVECPTCAAEYWAGREGEEAREREQEAVTEAEGVPLRGWRVRYRPDNRKHPYSFENERRNGMLFRSLEHLTDYLHLTPEERLALAPLRALVGAGVAS